MCFRSFSVKLLGASFRSFSVCSARRTVVLSDAGAKVANVNVFRRGMQASGAASTVRFLYETTGSSRRAGLLDEVADVQRLTPAKSTDLGGVEALPRLH